VFANPWEQRPWRSAEEIRRKAWVPLLIKAGITYRNLYQTRHTFASLMVSGGEYFPWVSSQMGHETMLTTARYYARWLPNPNIFGGYQPNHHW
jgi:integrase